MINILPPEFKEQITYSQRNVIARRYLLTLGMIALFVGGALGVSHWYADQELARNQERLSELQREIDQFSETESAVSSLNTQLESIEALLKQRPKFSIILEDLAAVLPANSYINGINLTEDIEQPLQLTITTPSRSAAIRVRDALLTSGRIGSADIQHISASSEGEDTVDVGIIIAFDMAEEANPIQSSTSESESDDEDNESADTEEEL